MTHFFPEKFAYIKKKQYLCSEFKTYRVMRDKTIISFNGFGHRVQLIQRENTTRSWVLMDNRRVVVSAKDVFTGKAAFLNHVASIVRQRQFEL